MAQLDPTFPDIMRGKTIKQVAKEMLKLRDRHTAAKNKNAELWAKVEYLSMNLLPKMMDDLGTTSMKIDGIGRLNVRTEATCKTKDKEALFAWLRDSGNEDIISPVAETVNASRLKSFLTHQLQDGEPIPDEKIIDFGTYELAVITKG